MNSLGNKIQSTFIVSISVVAVCALLMLSINQINSLQTQQLVDTMTTEYSLISLSNDLVETYNVLAKSPEDTQLLARYQSFHATILSNLTKLNTTITQPETRILLMGVDHTVRSVMDECDKGLADVKQNNFASISDHYAQANKDNEFVNDNTRTLLGKELEILYTSQKNVQHTYIVTMAVTSGLFLLIIGIIIVSARSFTIQLIRPLTTLSIFAKDIASGNLQAREKQVWKITNDEIGSLTQSIQIMVDRLVAMIAKEQHTNEEIKITSDILSQKNKELQEMNALMVGREVRMAELKKEIEELKAKSLNQSASSSNVSTS